MTERAFNKIMAGLTEAVEIAEGRADPSTYRIHNPAETTMDEQHRADLAHLAEAFRLDTPPDGEAVARVVTKTLVDLSSVASSLERIAKAQEVLAECAAQTYARASHEFQILERRS